MKRKMRKLVSVSLLFLLCACQSNFHFVKLSHQSVSIMPDTGVLLDQTVLRIIEPYKLKLDSQMNQRIMVASQDLVKENPEGSLGNMVCDELMQYAFAKGLQVDLCVLNSGGLRIPTIYKGDIYIRTIFELLPFDNELVVLDVTGDQLEAFLNVVAANGGWPVSGIRMKIGNTKAQDIQFTNGKPFEHQKVYRLLTSDYLAGGGDMASMLKNPLNYESVSVMLRTALIEQLKNNFYEGETLQAIKDGRITKE
jgi:2',3'-cyclic-nucleotide 2'-phosphodiesterase (5'-nucleotidase family)